LIGRVRDFFLLTAETEGLAQVIALRADFGERRAGFLRLAIWKAGQSERAVQTKTLRKLRVEIKLAALPEPPA
jgi:hypothetical protein